MRHAILLLFHAACHARYFISPLRFRRGVIALLRYHYAMPPLAIADAAATAAIRYAMPRYATIDIDCHQYNNCIVLLMGFRHAASPRDMLPR